jgi:diguanylate cyclase (GGDEF)-like protein
MIASRLKQLTRDDDTVSRHGGDEFLYLLLELRSEENAIMIAKRIIQTLGEPCDVDANSVSLSLRVRPSIGIALFPKHGGTADELVRSADRAMYCAKRDKAGYALPDELETLRAGLGSNP